MGTSHLPFERLVKLERLTAETVDWLIFASTTSQDPAREIVVERRAYEAMLKCGASYFSGEDTGENARLELEIILEDRYRADPDRALVVPYEDVDEAMQRYRQPS